MADLPKERITPSGPFEHVGLDFGGPLMLKNGTNGEQIKAYLAVFVCFATKAVHIEAVSGLSTAACVVALRRFAARRGAPTCMYSDNGTNFVGTRKELSTLQEVLDTTFGRKAMPQAAAEIGSSWSTIPPGALPLGALSFSIGLHGK